MHAVMREHHGFFEHRDSCGEEGLRGPMRQADGALRRMYDAVRGRQRELSTPPAVAFQSSSHRRTNGGGRTNNGSKPPGACR